jgi:DNA end-binding protein Ku
MPARAIGTATISFGLVSIPVKLYTTAESSHEIHFNMLHDACGSRLKQQYVCTKDGELVDREHTVKGYQFAKDQYVVLSGEELKALDQVATHAVDLVEFVPAAAVDPLFLDKAYYLGPEKGGERAYHLLGEAMLATQLVGVASYAARGKSYIVLVRPFENGLVMHQLHYADELKEWRDVPMPDLPDVKSGELELAKQIIQQIAADVFTPQKYKDEVKARMLALIEKKIEGQEITAAPEVPQGKIIDLMEALKASLSAGAGGAAPDRLPARAVDAAADAAEAAAEAAGGSPAPKKKSSRRR